MDEGRHDGLPAGTITRLLHEARDGARAPLDRLFEIVYGELKEVARGELRHRTSSEFRATSLVNAAYARLLGRGSLEAQDRRHLFFLFGRAMRDVLVEHARANRAARRGGGRTILSIDGDACEAPAEGVDILELHEALDTLANHDPGAARVVVLRFFGGRTLRDIVELEERSLDAVRRDWEYARAWLQARMGTP